MVTPYVDYVSSLSEAIQKPGFLSKLPGLLNVEIEWAYEKVAFYFHFEGQKYLTLMVPAADVMRAYLKGDLQKYVAFRLAEYRVEVRSLMRKIPARHLLIGGPKHGEHTVVEPERLHKPLIVTVAVPPMVPAYEAVPVAFVPHLTLDQAYYPHVMALNKHYFIPFFHESVPPPIRETLFDATLKETEDLLEAHLFSGEYEVCL